MPFDIHTLEVQDASPAVGATTQNGCGQAGVARSDRVLVAALADVASDASGSTTFVNIPISLNLPAKYMVEVTPSAACIASVASKTSTGFTVTLTGNGTGDVPTNVTFDLLVFA